MTRWLDDEEMAAWRGLVETFADLSATLEAELIETHGLSMGEYGTMVRLSEAPDRRLRMCDLAEQLHLSASGLTRRIEDLVKRGWVRREPDASDRRVINAVLTPEGFARLAEAAPAHVDGVRRHLLDRLTRAQIRELAGIVQAVGAHDVGTAAER